MTDRERIDGLFKIAGFFEVRADMAVGDAKMLLLNWMKCAQEAAEALKKQTPVVHCRDCKHRPTDNRVRDNDSTGLAIEFPDSRCPCQCEDGWYNWYPNDDWFCADGERRDDDAADTW